MHELSIVMSIISASEKAAKEKNAAFIKKIELEIGTMSGIELDALNFAWKRATPGTMLENAVKEIHIIQAKARCLECNADFEIENVFDACPNCGSYFRNIYQGKEMRIKALEIDFVNHKI